MINALKLSTIALAVTFIGSLSLDAYASRDGGGGRARGGRGMGHDSFHRDRGPQQVTKHVESRHKTKPKKVKRKAMKPKTSFPLNSSYIGPQPIHIIMGNEIVILELEKPKEAHDVPYQRYLEEMYKRGYLKGLEKNDVKGKDNQSNNSTTIFTIPSTLTLPSISIPENYFGKGFSDIHFLPELNGQSIQMVPFFSATDFQNIYFITKHENIQKPWVLKQEHFAAQPIYLKPIPIRPPDIHGSFHHYQPTKVEQPQLEWKRIPAQPINISDQVM